MFLVIFCYVISIGGWLFITIVNPDRTFIGSALGLAFCLFCSMAFHGVCKPMIDHKRFLRKHRDEINEARKVYGDEEVDNYINGGGGWPFF